MELTQKARKELQEIMQRDYRVVLSDEQANRLGVSLLRLAKLSHRALARAGEKSPVRARERSLGPKTST